MTPFIKKKDIKKDWYIINAQNIAVGRLAAYISKVLRGKNKSTYNPHIDNGDYVVVTNIDKIKFTGKKPDTNEPAHTAMCHLGHNPMIDALDVIEELRKYESERIREIHHPLLEKHVGRSTNLLFSFFLLYSIIRCSSL